MFIHNVDISIINDIVRIYSQYIVYSDQKSTFSNDHEYTVRTPDLETSTLDLELWSVYK